MLSGRRWRCRPRVLKLKENSTCSHRLILDSFYSYVVHHLHTSTQRIPAHPSTSSSVAHLVAVWMACSAALGGSGCCCWGMFREGVDILTHQHDHGSEPRWLSASSTVFQGPSKIACGTNSGTAVTCGKNSWRTPVSGEANSKTFFTQSEASMSSSLHRGKWMTRVNSGHQP